MEVDPPTKECAICMSPVAFGMGDPMPCDCRTRTVHHGCFAEWLGARRHARCCPQLPRTCEVCHAPYFKQGGQTRWAIGGLVQRLSPAFLLLVLWMGWFVCRLQMMV